MLVFHRLTKFRPQTYTKVKIANIVKRIFTVGRFQSSNQLLPMIVELQILIQKTQIFGCKKRSTKLNNEKRCKRSWAPAGGGASRNSCHTTKEYASQYMCLCATYA